MASVGFMVGSALVNAFAFTDGNFLFSLANKNGSIKEIKRHNKAMEELSHKRDEWNKQQREIIEREQKSVRDFEGVSYVAELYHSVTDKTVKSKPKLEVEDPQLSNYYQLSDEQKKYECLFIVLGMGACFYASSKIRI